MCQLLIQNPPIAFLLLYDALDLVFQTDGLSGEILHLLLQFLMDCCCDFHVLYAVVNHLLTEL